MLVCFRFPVTLTPALSTSPSSFFLWPSISSLPGTRDLFSSRTRTSPRLPSAGSVKTVGDKDSTHLCFPPLSLLQGRVRHPNGCSNGLGGLPSCKQRHTLRERNCEDTRRSRRHGYGRHLDGPKGATPFPALAAIFLPRPAYIYPIPTLLLYHVCFTGTMTNVCPLLGSIF